MRTPRLVLSMLVAAPLALGALVALPGPAQAADTDVQINEFDSNGGFPDDWVELKNTGAGPVDISNWIVKDQTEGNNVTIPAATTLAAGALYTVDMGGLGNGDTVRVFTPASATLIDSEVYGAHAANGTWSACPEGGNTFVDRPGTKGLPNACANIAAWPGGSTVATVDNAGAFGDNESGLAYEGTGTATPGSLWMVQNNPGTLRKLNKTGGVWTETTQWTLKYAGALGNPDAEGVTIVNGSANDGIYVATERDGAGGSLPMILRYAPLPGGGTISPVDQFSLADLPGLGANAGPEAVAWVPDSYLTAKGFKKDGGATYNPADFPGHGTGLFFVGVEQTGEVIGYALDHVADTATRVVTIPHFQSTVTDLVFDPARQKLWAECDDNCGGRTSLLDISTTGPSAGTFAVSNTYERPATTPNLNNEGFTITPNSECAGGVKPVFWADDANTGTHVLSAGTIACSPPALTAAATSSKPKTASGWYGAPVTVSFTCTAGVSPLATGACPGPVTLSASGADQTVTRSVTDIGGISASATLANIDIDLVKPTAKITGVKKGKTYPSKKKPKCKASDALSGLDSCTVKQKKKGSKYKVTATATDKAGNVTVVTLTYKVR